MRCLFFWKWEIFVDTRDRDIFAKPSLHVDILPPQVLTRLGSELKFLSPKSSWETLDFPSSECHHPSHISDIIFPSLHRSLDLDPPFYNHESQAYG